MQCSINDINFVIDYYILTKCLGVSGKYNFCSLSLWGGGGGGYTKVLC